MNPWQEAELRKVIERSLTRLFYRRVLPLLFVVLLVVNLFTAWLRGDL